MSEIKDNTELDAENWPNTSFKQVLEEIIEIKKRLNELETGIYRSVQTINR